MRERNAARGFTLVEALLAVAVVGLAAAALSDTFGSGLRSLGFQSSRQRLDSEMRSRMELLLAQPPATLTNGSSVVAVDGTNYTVSWQIQTIDLDGDTVAEPSARQVTVTAEGRSLVVILADPMGQVSKI